MFLTRQVANFLAAVDRRRLFNSFASADLRPPALYPNGATRNAPSRVPRQALDPGVPRKGLVNEGVVEPEKLQDARVVPEDVGEVLLRLRAHRPPQGLVEAGEEVLVRGRPRQPAELEPLAGEVLDE